MQNNTIKLPLKKGYDLAYELSFQTACKELRSSPDILARCHSAGADCWTKGQGREIVLNFLGETYVVDWPEIDVATATKYSTLPLRDKLLILHYLNTAKGSPYTNHPVTFRELPAGEVYLPTYTKRAIRPFVEAFTNEPERLLHAALKLGGHEGTAGDVSVVINAFPKVAITYVLWKGDDELPAEGNILYDANISDYLPTEDITVLTESITWRMVRS